MPTLKDRVITPFGTGVVIQHCLGLEDDGKAERFVVDLDAPHYSDPKMMALQRGGVFLLSDYALVRVINVNSVRVFSNLQFFRDLAEARRALDERAPQNETRFFLNLATGDFSASNSVGRAGGRYLWPQPWLDRWAREESGYSLDFGGDRTLREFDLWEAICCGTDGGIFCPAFLDLETKQILRFAIAVTATRGVVYRKHFPP